MSSPVLSLARDGRVLGGRAILKAARNPATILGAVIFPLIFFVLFNVVMGRVMDVRGFDYAQLLPAAIVIQAMLFSAMASAYYVAGDRAIGITGRFRSLPIHPLAPLLGRAIGDVTRASVSLAVVLVAGFITGMRFQAGIGWLPVYVGVALLFAVAASFAMGFVGYVATSAEGAASIASIPYAPLIMLSSAFAPVEDFPGWLQGFVEWQPVTVAIDALRALAGDGDIGVTLIRTVIWSAVFILVFAPLVARRLKRIS